MPKFSLDGRSSTARVILFIAFLFGLPALPGCAPHATTGQIFWDYFPMHVGDEWTFQEIDGAQSITRITGTRSFEGEAYFVIEHLPELGSSRPTQRQPAQRYLRFDAKKHQLVEYAEQRRIILLNLESLIAEKFPFTIDDKLLAGHVIPAGSFDHYAEQSNCAYDPHCTLGRTIYVYGIGPVAHARFPNRANQLAEYGYYLKRAVIDGVRYDPFFVQEVKLTWGDAPEGAYRVCSPPAQFLSAAKNEAIFEVRDGSPSAATLGIVRMVGISSFGPAAAPGVKRIQRPQFQAEIVAGKEPGQWALKVQVPAHTKNTPTASALSSYLFLLEMKETTGSVPIVCYLGVEPP
ncbi:hypothetical protein HY230_01160 [Candidatus Acetothermia bacterium]|nr:hypothetical protein [Candidatus Acetothermia bacterium]